MYIAGILLVAMAMLFVSSGDGVAKDVLIDDPV